MKVLHVIPSLAARTGGPAVAAIELARVAAEHGVEPMIFATDAAFPAGTASGAAVTPEELPAEAAEVPTRLFPLRRPYRLARSPELRKALRREIGGYDALHIHSLYLYPQRVAAKAARRKGVPYVVSPHGALDPWLRKRGRVRKALAGLAWQRRMLQRAAALHFTSEEESSLAGSFAPGVPRKVVPLGIDWASFQELPPPASFGEGPVVLALGRLAAKKGLDLLIAAFALARTRFPTATLVVAGPDDEGLQSGLQEQARARGVGDAVVFPGMLTGRDKLAALAAADVWALASHTENFGIAVVEALASGVATLISPAVNLAGEIERAGAGVVSDTKPEAFAGALSYLLEDTERRAQYAERGREFARRYDWDAVAPQIVQLYEGVARSPSR
jgi:glycosyltransferase involved in cell wall biosynthesis